MTALRLKWRRRLCERKICRFWSLEVLILEIYENLWSLERLGIDFLAQ